MFNIPQNIEGLTVFMSNGLSLPHQSWVKPAGCQMIYIVCIGAGGGGGSGFTGVAGTARGGGGGGGGGAINMLLIPAYLLPERLGVVVGLGGNGAGQNGSGSAVYISRSVPATTAPNLLLATNQTSAGGNGSGTAAGAAGAGAAALTPSSMLFSALGSLGGYAGFAGIIGGAQTGANGGAQTVPTSWTMGGTGGAGTPIANTDFAGGALNITDSQIYPVIPGGTAGGGRGQDGFTSLASGLWVSTPGTGGGSNGAAGVGGAGGNGGIGCGGGGGGAGVTGGAGGRGGDGIVMIYAF